MFLAGEGLEQIFLNSPLAMWVQDPYSFGFLDANQAALALFGLSREGLLSKTWKEFLDGNITLPSRPEGRFRHILSDGRSLDLNLSAHDLDSDNPALLVIAQDLSPMGQASERHYRQLFERSLAGIFKTSLDGNFLDCNEAFAHMLRYGSREEMLSLSARHLYFNDSDRDALINELRKNGALNNYEVCLRRKDGTAMWGIENVMLLVEDGRDEIIEGTLVDITTRKHLEDLNLGQQHLLQMVAQNMPLGVTLKALVDLVAQQIPGASCAVLAPTLTGLDVLASLNLPEAFLRRMEGYVLLKEERPEGASSLKSLKLHDLRQGGDWEPFGELLPGLSGCWALAIFSGGQNPIGFFLLGLDEARPPRSWEMKLLEMTGRMIGLSLEHQTLTETLAHKAQHDPLTGLPNRLLFADRLAQAMALAQRRGRSVGVISLNLDGFKDINGTLGHAVGDTVLQDVAHRLKGALRDTDTLARMGGDDFLVLLTELADSRDAAKVAKKCAEAFRLPFPVRGYGFFLTASMGISLFPEDSEDPAALLRYADAALRGAKSQGRDVIQFYTPEMNTRARERLDLENHLRQAVHGRGFTLHYQPQFHADGRLLGFEALLRWTHPTLGTIPPSRFIPLAEETGLILPLGAWVLEEACRQMAVWHRAGFKGLRMAVNVSLFQFEKEGFLDSVAEVLGTCGLETSFLELELTESLVMKDAGGAASRLAALREMGVQVAIDDFGTGYSCLSYLQSLPIDTLKIDQSFVRDISATRGEGSNAIVETIVALGHNMGMMLVAEGVETEDQLAFLKSLGCQAIQGYLLGKPMPVDQCEAMLVRYFGKGS